MSLYRHPPHRGYECFDKLLDICHPKYMFRGHVHSNYGKQFRRTSEHPCGTTIINACDRVITDIEGIPPVPGTELLKKMLFAF
ncbi:MAG: hypothetical protein IKR73_09570 [Oscillospiraceae bacterium]|nr:hypothetical protein [Oscillospiraceae bacterium]